MGRIGLGGLQQFDATLGRVQVTNARSTFMTPAWSDALRRAVILADEEGLEFAIASSQGWSASGGPWVRPEQAMKKLVWTATQISGGQRFSGILATPPDSLGPFQNVPWTNPLPGGTPIPKPETDFYRDVAVLAYPLPAGEHSMYELQPAVTTSAGPIDSETLWDGDYTTGVKLPISGSGEPAWIQLAFPRPQTIRAMTLALEQNLDYSASYVAVALENSQDDHQYRTIVSIRHSNDPVQTVSFAPTTGRYFRLLLYPAPPTQAPAVLKDFVSPPQTSHHVLEFALHTADRVNHFQRQGGFFLDDGHDEMPQPEAPGNGIVHSRDIRDLTSAMRADGTLEWQAPPGRWVILRIGYSLIGKMNRPAAPEATGLEIDKLDATAVRDYLNHYLDLYRSAVGPELVGGRGIRAMVNDSWEAGPQNWTDSLPSEFSKRRGYDIRRWLPVLTGVVVDGIGPSTRFLWDFRRTLGELVSDNYFAQTARVLHQQGLINYVESHEVDRAFFGDGMDAKRNSDVPMSAMWADEHLFSKSQGDADLRESASVAHLYGQSAVSAESMTALGLPGNAYAYSPEKLKPTADRELIDGVNRFVIHTSVHQPTLENTSPGLSLGPFGQWFTRKETWADSATPWVLYLARSGYLMQQGTNVADLLYYYGQNSNITALYGHSPPPVPEGYAFDFANSDALTQLSVKNGALCAHSGTCYRALVLDPRAKSMSLDVLKTISILVSHGAVVIGGKPQDSPSLADERGVFSRLADTTWGFRSRKIHHYGKGLTIAGTSIEAALRILEQSPDFSYIKTDPATTLWYAHRKLPNADVYFLVNPGDRAEHVMASFRVLGASPELWRADSGTTQPLSFTQGPERIHVPLDFTAHDAYFVVFRGGEHQPSRTIVPDTRTTLSPVEGPWMITFESDKAQPLVTTVDALQSWSVNTDPSIKYFSGTAVYETRINIPETWIKSPRRLEVDLGAVANVAEVFVGEQSVGIVWKPPFRVDLTKFLLPGFNTLRIQVTNLWPNRLIGYKQLGGPQSDEVEFNPYEKDSPLLASGLLGPVELIGVTPGLSSD